MSPDQMTEDQKRLIRGMNFQARGPYARPGNIGALYFDGPELEDLLKAHREIERVFGKL